MKHNKIVLVGFMGSGKTTLAKKLAKKLNLTCFDLDQLIEENQELNISQIFEEKGENYFRTIENNILTDFLKNEDNFVLSLGGGTPCFNNNMKAINEVATSIYLKYNAGILASRLINAKKKRPLIANLNQEELNAFINNKLKERESDYNKSLFTITGNNLKVEDLICVLQ